MNQEKVVAALANSMANYGVKGSFIAKELGISYTFLKQVIKKERFFSSQTLEKAIELLNKYPNIIE
jgi:nitrogen regulatory protein PII-like uncharacterized protein